MAQTFVNCTFNSILEPALSAKVSYNNIAATDIKSAVLQFINKSYLNEFISFVVDFIAPRKKSEKEKCTKADQEKI